MAQKVIVVKTCDLDHEGEDVEGVETITFGFDGRSYEMDLCAEHSDEVQDEIQGWIAVSRAAAGQQRQRRTFTGSGTGGRTTPKEELAAMRDWARSNGFTVSDRGRVSAEIREAFVAAQK